MNPTQTQAKSNGSAPTTALATASTVALVAGEGWPQEKIDLVKRTVCPSGITNDELALFLAQCKRSGLDPLIGEAFCVPRKVSVQAPSGEWTKVQKHVFQAGEGGMEARADRFPDFGGIKAAAVYDGDAIEIDAAACTVKHTFNPAKRGGKLVGAWAQVFRQGRALPIVWVDYAAYALATPNWQSKPATMIVKCARAAGLRIAYPNVFGDSYVGAELGAEDDSPEEKASPQAQATARARAAAKAQKDPAPAAALHEKKEKLDEVEQRTAQEHAKVGAEAAKQSAPASAQTVDVKPEPSAAPPPPPSREPGEDDGDDIAPAEAAPAVTPPLDEQLLVAIGEWQPGQDPEAFKAALSDRVAAAKPALGDKYPRVREAYVAKKAELAKAQGGSK